MEINIQQFIQLSFQLYSIIKYILHAYTFIGQSINQWSVDISYSRNIGWPFVFSLKHFCFNPCHFAHPKMQGDFPVDAEPTFCNAICSSYAQRKSPAEFFKFGAFSIPLSVDEAFIRSKTNVPKFLFYYICIAAVAMLFVILTRPIILIPIAVCAGAIYISLKKLDVAGVKLTPQYVTYGCVAIVILLSLLFSKIMSSYLVMIALLSISTAITLLHACLMEDIEGSHPAGTL